MKLLFVGDPHNQVRTPANRTDDFHETYINKVNEIKEIAREEKVSAILQPGDFLNQPQYNNEFIMEVIKLWSFVPEKYELLEKLRNGEGDPLRIADKLRSDIPYIGAIGNHELIGESLNSYPRTSLAFMEKLGFMKMASKEEPIILRDEDGTKVAITATHYHHGMDKPEHVEDYIVNEKQGDVHIHMVHGYLAHKSLGDLIRHTLVDSIVDTQADVTLAGHDHIGFSQVEIDGKLFANPGALTRTKADVKEISRMPKVLIVEIKNGKVSIEERTLKSAKPGKEILDRTSIAEKADKMSKIESIKSIVKKAKINKGQSVTDIIEAIAKADGIDTEITEDVVKRVTDKIESFGEKESATVQKYKLVQIVLENFQSHEHSVFDVSEGLNIFTGESSNGKSAVMRAMRWLMDNHGKSQRESFIRHGATKAKVSAVFEDGTRVSRVLDKKAHGHNGWEIYNPITDEVESGNTQLVNQIKELFGYTKIQYDTKDELDVNFMNQGDGWYFIGQDVKSSDRAKIIGAIFGTHYTDGVMKDLESIIRQTRVEMKVREEDVKKVNEELAEFDYLNDVERRLREAEPLVTQLQKMEERLEEIKRLEQKKSELYKQEKEYKKTLSKLSSLPSAYEMLEDLKALAEKHSIVVNTVNNRTKLVKEGRTSRSLVKNLENLEQAKEYLIKLENRQSVLSELTKLKDKYSDVIDQANKEKNIIKVNETKIVTLQTEYKNLLKESGTCPTCGQLVNEHSLKVLLAH